MDKAFDFDFDLWRTRFLDELRKDHYARASWERLLKAGCEPDLLAYLLALSCDFDNAPGYTAWCWLRRDGLQRARQSLKLASRLDSDRDSLLAHWNMNVGQDELWSSTVAALQPAINQRRDALLAALAATTSELRAEAKQSSRELSKRSLNPSFFVASLVSAIKEATGRQHFREIAELIGIAYLAHGRECTDAGEEAIRKVVQRFRRKSAHLTEDEREHSRLIAIVLMLAAAYVFRETQSAQ